MNALELADKLENHYLGKNECENLDQAATMLRQLQAEIEALKMEIHSLPYGERLAKHLNEPVAYACQIVEVDFDANIIKIEMLDKYYKVSAGTKFLCDEYTHPAKELNAGGEPVKNASYWKRKYDKAQSEIEVLKKQIQNQSLDDLMDWQQELDTAKTDKAELDTRSYMLGYADGKEAMAKIFYKDNPLQDKLDTLANKLVFGKAQEK